MVSGRRRGEKGAISMKKYLAQDYVPVNDKVVTPAEINTGCFDKSPRAGMPRLTVAARESNFAEVNLGLAQKAAIAEAERCFSCGRCNLCENCYIFCPDLAIAFDDEVRSFTVNRVLCKACGICITECPRSAILWEDKA
jgi:Pyruvate/2-oxoacid:ferredoxin oxidoreductase delta subunit